VSESGDGPLGGPGPLGEVLGGQGIGLCLVGANFRVRWANRRHVGLHAWGVPAGECCYRSLAGGDRPCAGCVVKEVLQTGRASSVDRCMSTAAGDRRVRLTASPVYGPSRQLEQVLLTTVEAPRDARPPENDEAEKMASLGVMAAGLVHELNNVIGGMSGHAELAMLYPEREETTRHALEIVIQNSRRARGILKQLVNYSQQQTGEVTSVSLVEVIEQVLDITSRNLELAEVRVVRRFDSSPTVVGRPWRLRLLLVNLMLDAMDRVRRNSELVVVVQECRGAVDCARKPPRCEDKGCVRLVLSYELQPCPVPVSETAGCCGFERTATAGPPRHDTFAAASRAVGEMGGDMRLSEDGPSRRIEVTIPLDVTSSGGDVVQNAPGTVGPRRALVVDDEEVICELVSAVLTDEGYEVITAVSGRSAVELLRTQRFDVVVLDVMIPGELNGLAALHEIRQIRPACRVILMTGRLPDDELEAQFRQADAHVLKPFHCQQLIDRLRDVAV